MALDAAMSTSAARACQTDTDCTKITSPRSLVPALARVVRRDDAARLDGEARALLARCGPSAIYDEGLEAFDVVEPRCVAAKCTASVTTYHISDP